MTGIRFQAAPLSADEQAVVSEGFAAHSRERGAPAFERTKLAWRAFSERDALVGALTGQLLWDWVYVDELWVDASLRGTGLGRRLMLEAEAYARDASVSGLWLWTQSWQAEGFYLHLGYEEFARFPEFPKGHSRIGLRKILAPR